MALTVTQFVRLIAFGVAVAAASAPAVVGQGVPRVAFENVSGAPFPDRLIFNRIGSLGAPPPANGVHDRSSVRVSNTGTADLTVTGLSVSGARFVIDSAPALPAVVAAGSSVDVAVRFVADSGNRSGGTRGMYDGSLRVDTDDPVSPSVSVELAGYWQSISEGGKEPKLVEIIRELYGYRTTIVGPGQSLNNQGRVEAVGEEILSPYWRRADANRPVTVRQLAAFHGCCVNRVPVYWTRQGSTNVSLLFRHDGADGQAVLPRKDGATTPAVSEFTPPADVFGFRVANNEYSDPSLNDSSPDDCSGGPETCGQHVRFWPVRDRSGTLVSGQALMVMDYAGINYDYNDNVYLLENVVPRDAPEPPAAPTALAAEGTTAGVALDWADSAESELSGYNVYRSDQAGGPYALAASVPAATSDYLDGDLAAGERAFYTVTAAGQLGLESGASSEAYATRLKPISAFTQIAWGTAASQPYANTEAQAATVDGALYVFGGYDIEKRGAPCNCFTPTARAYAYDPAANTWSSIADLPFPNGGGITHAGITTDGADIFIGGGFYSNATNTGQIIGTRQVWRYNVASNTYTALPDLPAESGSGQLQYLDGRLHYFGGMEGTGAQDESGAAVADHYVLDYQAFAAGGSPAWASAAPFPNPRHHMGSVVLNGQIYAVGGQQGYYGAAIPQATVHAYDPVSDAWTERASLPLARANIGATIVHEGRILVMGGEDDPPSGNVADVTAYDPESDTWSQLTPLPVARKVGVAGSLGEDLYYTTGAPPATAVTYRGVPDSGIPNEPPTASFAWSSPAPLEVAFDGSGSSDADGAVVSWRWDFGDGSPADAASGPSVSHTYAAVGSYAVTLTVADGDGAANSVTRNVTVSDRTTAVVAQAGSVSVTQTDSEMWTAVAFEHTFANPVVVAGPPTYNGTDPTTVRVRNVTGTGFEVQVDEWDYLDGAHDVAEEIGWLAVEAGIHQLADGRRLEARHVTAAGAFADVGFSAPFVSPPAVLTQVASADGSAAVAPRLQNVRAGGFELAIQAQESSQAPVAADEVGWVAVGVGPAGPSGVAEAGTAGTVAYGVGMTAATVKETPSATSFATGFGSAPVVVTSLQTYNGADPSVLRRTALSASAFSVFVQEEQSADGEVRHAGEVVAWVAAEPGLLLSEGTSNEPPTASFAWSSPAPLAVAFDGSGSSDADGSVVRWRWDFGDGSPVDSTSGASVSHTYEAAGSYAVTLAVTDDGGATGSQTQGVSVAAPACTPYSTVECLSVPVSWPFELSFDADPDGLRDASGVGTGFTAVPPPSASPDGPPSVPAVPGYEPSNLTVDLSAGTLTVAATPGLFDETPDTVPQGNGQRNALAVGLDTVDGAPFEVVAGIVALPALGNASASEQAGVWFGLDEDDYVKLVIRHTGSGYQVRLLSETAAVPAGLEETGDVTAGGDVRLKLVLDPAASTAVGSYSLDAGETFVQLAEAVAVNTTLFEGLALPDGVTGPVSFAGLLASRAGGTDPFDVVFESFSVQDVPVVAARPSVSGTSPTGGAAEVARDAFVAVDIALPNVGQGIDESTLSSATVRLYPAGTPGAAVPANLNTSAGGDAIVLQPLALLAAHTPYTFEVTEGLRDLAGQPFLPYTASFTTGATPTGAPTSDILFEQVTFDGQGTEGRHSSLTVGPDGRLYATTITGELKRWDIGPDGTLSNVRLITSLRDAEGGNRLAIGLVFDPASTADSLVAWVSHSKFGFSGQPDWGGKIARLSGPDLGTASNYVVGLPRSIRDHVTNGMTFGPDGALYVLQGSNSAMGAADDAWGNRPERLLSAALLRVDVAALEAGGVLPLDVKTEEGGTYDPYATAAPVKVYASGLRNAYDLVWHSNGNLYVPTNGSAANGNAPASVDGVVRPDGTPYTGPAVAAIDSVETQDDFLFRIPAPAPDGTWGYHYYGHPNPSRGEFVLNGGNPTASEDPAQVDRYPVGVAPDVAWAGAAYNFGRSVSPNGVIEYQGGAFEGALRGKLLVVRYSGGDDIVALTPDDGDGDIAPSGDFELVVDGVPVFNDPLELTEDPATGNLYLSEYGGAGRISLLRPVGAASNQPPVAAFTASPSGPLAVAFDGSGSSDSDGAVARWRWSFGDGSPADSTSGASVSHTYAAAGSYAVTLTVADDGGATDSAVRDVAVTGGAAGPYLESDGLVVFEAESAERTARGGHSWEPAASGAGAVGGAVAASPNIGANVSTDVAGSSPELRWPVRFATPGPYYVWGRVRAATNDDDSFHAGLDGVAVATAARMTTGGATGGGWTWTRQTMAKRPATLSVGAGDHAVNVWMREDGLELDRVLLTTSPSYVPAGAGPPESPRDGDDSPPPVAGLTWSQVAPQPYANTEAQTQAVGGKLYAFGGFDILKKQGPCNCFVPTARSYVYDPAADAWSAIANLPFPNGGGVTHAGTTTDGTNIFLASGYISNTDGTGQVFGTRQVWRYNVGGNTYTRLPDLPVERAAGQLQYVGGKLHYFGGTNKARTVDVADHYVLDYAALLAGGSPSWTTAAPFPNPRHHMGSAVYNGRIYAVGGQHNHDGNAVPQASVHSYDPASDTWAEHASMPTALSHIAVTLHDGRIVVLGGEAAPPSDRVADVTAYDPQADTWTQSTPLPQVRKSGVGVSIGGVLYYTTGANASGPTAVTYRGVPDSGVPNQPPVAAFASSPSGPLAVAFDGSGSSDSDGAVARWRWDFGDGSPADSTSGASVSHTYAAAGSYAVTLTVADNGGASASVTRDVAVTDGTTVPIAEAGSAAVAQSGPSAWTAVTFGRTFTDPVVVAGPPSYAGSDPSTVRVQAVTGAGFEVQVDEWDYLDGAHASEAVAWLAVEAGIHQLADGRSLEAGRVTAGGAWKAVAFGSSFSSAPVVLVTPSAATAAGSVAPRLRNVTATGFEVLLQAQESITASPSGEEVSWVAIAAGPAGTSASGSAGVAYRVGQTATNVTDRPAAIAFASPFASAPVVVAGMQTFAGADPSALRRTAVSGSSFTVFAEEEQSADSEVRHGGEAVGWFAAERGVLSGSGQGSSDALAVVAPLLTTGPPPPDEAVIERIWPNPSRGAARVRYGVPEAGAVAVEVFDTVGRRVAVLAEGSQSEGWHEAEVGHLGLPAGIYFVRLQTGAVAVVRSFTIVR